MQGLYTKTVTDTTKKEELRARKKRKKRKRYCWFCLKLQKGIVQRGANTWSFE